MNADAPLLAVLVLSGMLLVNFFRAAWHLGILKAFGRRQPTTWRSLAACIMAACLPFAGTLVALMLLPTDTGANVADVALPTAIELALSGLVIHLINDELVQWGKTPALN